MKFALTAIASIILTTILTGKVNALPQNPTQSIVTTEATTTNPAQSDSDQALLSKGISNFFRSDRYLTRSESLLKGNLQGGGFEVTAQSSTKTIVQSGGKFRSEITFKKPDESQGITSLVVSDGKKVWIYRSDLKQYAVTSSTKFEESQEESFLIGISSMLFLSIDAPTRWQISSPNTSSQILDELKLDKDSAVKVEKVTVDGKELYACKYKAESFSISGFIEPDTTNLNQMQISGETEGIKILMTEKILERTPHPSIDAQTFIFTPPPGVKKVDSLSISPF